MTASPRPWLAGALVALLLMPPSLNAADVDWKEVEPSSAPAFNRERLVRFDALGSSDMRFGVDPATVSLGSDGVVRYVMVVTSPSGALNASYDGVHCHRGEFKNYARWSPASASGEGHWNMAEQPEWRSLSSGHATRPALALARAAFCEGAAPNGSVDKMLRELRQGR